MTRRFLPGPDPRSSGYHRTPPPEGLETPTATSQANPRPSLVTPKRMAWTGFLGLVVAALAVTPTSLAVVLYLGGFVWLLGFGALGVVRRSRSVVIVHPDLPQDHPHFHVTP